MKVVKEAKIREIQCELVKAEDSFRKATVYLGHARELLSLVSMGTVRHTPKREC
jgi:hypothetical protein